jgi:hypothetical protein
MTGFIIYDVRYVEGQRRRQVVVDHGLSVDHMFAICAQLDEQEDLVLDQVGQGRDLGLTSAVLNIAKSDWPPLIM